MPCARRSELAIGVEHRHVERKAHARPRHDLALEGIAMEVDDARQHHATRGVQLGAGARGMREMRTIEMQ
jgi:hypothetical protein